MTFEKGTSDEGFRPDDRFETEVEWVHSRRDETDMTVTYRAEFAPAEEDLDADLYFMEMRVPTEADPEVTALMAELNDAGDRSSWRIAAVEGFRCSTSYEMDAVWSCSVPLVRSHDPFPAS